MARGLNKAMLIGNLGKDPEVRELESGAKVARVVLATSESYTDKKTNEKKEITEWHNVNFWGGLADVVERYVKKGDQIYVEGQIRTRKWTDKEGNDRYTTEIRGNEMQMLGGKRNDGGGAGAPAATSPAQNSGSAPEIDDDLPF